MYNPPADNITNIAGIFGWVDGVTGGWLFSGIVLAVYFIILAKLMFNSSDLGKSFTGASFGMLVISVLLRVANLVSTPFMVIFIILTGIGVVWMHMENSRYD